MSGVGKRFKDAGYKIPKPLIKVRGKEIINHVVNMFEKIERVIFICNEDHLNDHNLNLRKILKNLCIKFQCYHLVMHFQKMI